MTGLKKMFKLTQIHRDWLVRRKLQDKTKGDSHITERTLLEFRTISANTWTNVALVRSTAHRPHDEVMVATPGPCMCLYVHLSELQQTLIMRLEAETVITGLNTK